MTKPGLHPVVATIPLRAAAEPDRAVRLVRGVQRTAGEDLARLSAADQHFPPTRSTGRYAIYRRRDIAGALSAREMKDIFLAGAMAWRRAASVETGMVVDHPFDAKVGIIALP
jgi:hypothetical protein